MKKIIILVLLLLLAFIGLAFAQKNGFLDNTPLATIPFSQTYDDAVRVALSNKNPEKNQATVSISKQSKVLGQRAKEINQHVKGIINQHVGINEKEDQPLYNKALDYGRYIYCKQVIQDYEQHQNNQETTQTIDEATQSADATITPGSEPIDNK